MPRRRRITPEQAARHLVRGAELHAAAHEVVAARLSMGREAAAGAATAAHLTEAATMVAEKAQAFGEAALLCGPASAAAARRMTDLMTAEAAAASRTAAAIAATPAAAATLMMEHGMRSSARLFEAWTAFGALAFSAQAAALRPVHRTASANARRLRRR